MENQRNVTVAAYGKSIGGIYPCIISSSGGLRTFCVYRFKRRTALAKAAFYDLDNVLTSEKISLEV